MTRIAPKPKKISDNREVKQEKSMFITYLTLLVVIALIVNHFNNDDDDNDPGYFLPA